MQQFFILILDIRKNKPRGSVKYFNFRQNRREFCLLCTVMYNLHVENKKTKKKKLITKKWQTAFCPREKSIQFTNENMNKNIIQTTVWFRQAVKKKNLKHYSHHKVINPDFKTSKNKRNKEILLREQ